MKAYLSDSSKRGLLGAASLAYLVLLCGATVWCSSPCTVCPHLRVHVAAASWTLCATSPPQPLLGSGTLQLMRRRQAAQDACTGTHNHHPETTGNIGQVHPLCWNHCLTGSGAPALHARAQLPSIPLASIQLQHQQLQSNMAAWRSAHVTTSFQCMHVRLLGAGQLTGRGHFWR